MNLQLQEVRLGKGVLKRAVKTFLVSVKFETVSLTNLTMYCKNHLDAVGMKIDCLKCKILHFYVLGSFMLREVLKWSFVVMIFMYKNVRICIVILFAFHFEGVNAI